MTAHESRVSVELFVKRKGTVMDDVPQFFQAGVEGKGSATVTNRAVYGVGDGSGDAAIIMVDGIDGSGDIPRNASALNRLESFTGAPLDIRKQFDAVAKLANAALESLIKLQPGEVEIQFGVKLGGKAGIPLVTEGSAEANFQVTLKWSGRAEGAGK